jgi:hypothetical protein
VNARHPVCRRGTLIEYPRGIPMAYFQAFFKNPVFFPEFFDVLSYAGKVQFFVFVVFRHLIRYCPFPGMKYTLQRSCFQGAMPVQRRKSIKNSGEFAEIILPACNKMPAACPETMRAFTPGQCDALTPGQCGAFILGLCGAFTWEQSGRIIRALQSTHRCSHRALPGYP